MSGCSILLSLLRRYLARAIAVLEKGQITVRDHLPRQLVPLRVEQISRAEWGVDQGADPLAYNVGSSLDRDARVPYTCQSITGIAVLAGLS